MWIALPNSFVSVVEKHGDPEFLQVRARTKKHLVNFLEDVPYEIVEDKKGEKDYRWRAIVAKPVVADLVHRKVLAIDWTNFKDRAKVEDPDLATMYGYWWYDHFSLQERVKGREKRAKHRGKK